MGSMDHTALRLILLNLTYVNWASQLALEVVPTLVLGRSMSCNET